MRAINAQMQNALAAHTRRPAFTVTIEDHTNHLTAYQAPGLLDMWSDVCVANDGSIVRVNLTRGAGGGFSNTFQFTRITDPSVAAQWTSVTAFPGGSGVMFQDGGCCVSNNAGVLRAFAAASRSEVAVQPAYLAAAPVAEQPEERSCELSLSFFPALGCLSW